MRGAGRSAVRAFLAAETALFAAAALLHGGLLLEGYAHQRARIAESVIATVLAAGLLWSAASGPATRRAGLLAQGFALLGTMVGAVMIAIGIGPRTALDLVLHATMLALLGAGLLAAWRMRGRDAADPLGARRRP